ncbi:MAG TPA: hypothetical protein VIC85_15980 [Ktedonobacterales bacterium]|jgi:hypothetical protein
MVTYEDITDMLLSAIEEVGLSAHPEFWLNTQTLEREFACTVHAGSCEEAENHAACTVSCAWGPLDTVLSIDGAEGICDFFHEPDDACPHLQTDEVLPLTLDLSYTQPLRNMPMNRATLAELQTTMRLLKLRASEHSSRAVETQPNLALVTGENGLQADVLTLQQRVELPLWDPEGVSGFHASGERLSGHTTLGQRHRGDYGDRDERDEPHPEDWLPHLLAEVAADIARVLDALDAVRPAGRMGSEADGPPEE